MPDKDIYSLGPIAVEAAFEKFVAAGFTIGITSNIQERSYIDENGTQINNKWESCYIGISDQDKNFVASYRSNISALDAKRNLLITLDAYYPHILNILNTGDEK